MATHAYSRESLLAEWDAIHPTEPMPIELLNLFTMMFVSTTERSSENHFPARILPDAPSPRRFQRRRLVNQCRAPAGPSNESNGNADKAKVSTTKKPYLPTNIPAGSGGERFVSDELDRVFEKIDRSPSLSK